MHLDSIKDLSEIAKSLFGDAWLVSFLMLLWLHLKKTTRDFAVIRRRTLWQSHTVTSGVFAEITYGT